MNMLLDVAATLAAFVAVLSLVVFVHEYGHFQAGRWCRMAIDTFSIGFGKSLVSWRDRKGVLWKIGALPLGGYVKFADDANAASAGPLPTYATPEDKAEARRRGMFHAQPLPARAFVIAAGPLANFIFSTLVFAVLLFSFGRDVTDVQGLRPEIGSVAERSAAAAAGLEPGDLVTAVDGAPVETWGAFRDAVGAAMERRIVLTVEREGRTLWLAAEPRRAEAPNETGVTETRGQLGVGPLVRPDDRVRERLGPLAALAAGAGETWRTIANTGAYIANIFSGRASGEHIAGPLGIARISGDVATAAFESDVPQSVLERVGLMLVSLLGLAAMISVAVGLANLLPIPVLDGGHLLLYAIEALRGGRPLPARAQEFAFRAGLAALLSLFLFATWNDLQRLFAG